MAPSPVVLHKLVDGLGELYDPAGPADHPARVIALVAELVGVESCSYNELSAAGAAVSARIEPAEVGTFPDAWAIFARHLPEHPVLAHQRRTGDGRSRRVSDFLSDRQFRALGLYRDFYRPAGVDHQMAVTVRTADGGLLGVALNRAGRDFSDDEVELVDLLRPHVRCSRELLPARQPAADDAGALTPRQRHVLQLVAAGYPDRAIGRMLRISIRTVHAHLQNAYRALGVTSRTQAVARLHDLAPTRPSG